MQPVMEARRRVVFNILGRRSDDKPVTRWKQWSAQAALVVGAFLLGEIVQARATNEVRNIVTSFVGGIMAIVLVWGALAKQVFENLQQVAESEHKVNEGLEKRLEEEKAERVKAVAELETRYQKQISEMEARHKNEMTALTTKVATLEAQYQAAITEKAALYNALAAAHAGKSVATATVG